MPDFRNFLPPPPWEKPFQRRSDLVSEEEFYQHIAEKYRIYIPEGVVQVAEPIHTISVALVIASYNIKQSATRRYGLALYVTAKEDAEAATKTGIVDELTGRYLEQQFTEIKALLERQDFREAGRLMDELSVNLNLLATVWMASRARKRI